MNLHAQETKDIDANPANFSVAGLSQDRDLEAFLEKGIEAVRAEDLKKTMRFISPEYRDSLGFNNALMKKLIKRAYKEFDKPQLHLKGHPNFFIDGNQASMHAEVRLSVIYSGRRNYILGDSKTYNSLLVRLTKYPDSWKIISIEGLRPLSFEEGLLKLLGAELGLPLTPIEKEENKRFCMPCRMRMKERFGVGN